MCLILFMVVAAINVLGCADENAVWGVPVDEFRSRVSNGNYEFLRHINYDAVRLDEVERLGEGAAYYVAHIAGELEMPEVREKLLRLSWSREPEPWRSESLRALLRVLQRDERYGELEEAAQEARASYTDAIWAEKAYLVSLYRQERDEDLLAALAGSPGKALRDTADAALWRSVAGYRLDRAGWQDGFRALFAEHAATIHHSRGYLFIIYRDDVEKEFGAGEMALFRAKHFLAEARYAEAYREFVAYVDALTSSEADAGADAEADAEPDTDPGVDTDDDTDIDPGAGPGRDSGTRHSTGASRSGSGGSLERYLTPATIHDIGVAALGSSMLTRGRGMLEDLADHRGLPEDGRGMLTLLEYRGRLALAVGEASEARTALSRALADAKDPVDRRRLLWYYLRALIDASPQEAALSIGGHLDEVSSPAYYEDLLEDLARKLVAAREWNALFRAHRSLQGVATPEIEAHYAFLVATAVEQGYLEQASGEAGNPIDLFREVAAQTRSPYYAFLAQATLGEPGPGIFADERSGAIDQSEEPRSSDADSAGPSAGESRSADSSTDDSHSDETERFVAGFFSFGLMDAGYREAREHAERLSEGALTEFARTLAAEGAIIDSMRLMDVTARRRDYVISKESAEIRYPHAFYQHVQTVAEEEELPLWIFYGLVREESYFDPAISSPAGAVGLAQLMPGTAGDVARRLGIENPDLRDPLTNLRLGAHYLGRLGQRLPSLTHALLAYNAGQTRVRRWISEYGDLPAVLFVEAVPFAETRDYLRKVLVSGTYYGYLYGDLTVRETAVQFFPDLPVLDR